MDHGCDTLNTVLNTITVLHFMNYDGPRYYLIMMIMGLSFFLPTLEQ